MDTLKRKMSSRKLWAAIVGILTGVAMIFGLDEHVINTVSGAVLAVGSIVAYITAEGKVDAARAKETVEKVQAAVDIIDDLD